MVHYGCSCPGERSKDITEDMGKEVWWSKKTIWDTSKRITWMIHKLGKVFVDRLLIWQYTDSHLSISIVSGQVNVEDV
jgi:hypothetical protein